MKTVFRRSFARDLKKIKNQSILERVKRAIEEVEVAANLQEISNLARMSGAGGFYRIRIGEYRIGIAVQESQIEFVRCLPRREIYRYFP